VTPDWTDIERTPGANVGLGVTLSFVAGATNAGGFLAVGSYTSHMTGVVSGLADSMVLRHWPLVWLGLASLLAFFFGAMTTAWIVNWALRRQWRCAFGLPLLLEALLLLLFGLFGAVMGLHSLVAPVTVLLLCFIMGLQNALVTKITNAEIRTTHVTGLVTDLGIEVGKLLYVNAAHIKGKPVRANRRKLGIHLRLIVSFFVGALAGAVGFKEVGYIVTLPLALALLLLVRKPLLHDLRVWRALA
jgi:uncharacterized membrane protein YoaK (UPF0700 family)